MQFNPAFQWMKDVELPAEDGKREAREPPKQKVHATIHSSSATTRTFGKRPSFHRQQKDTFSYPKPTSAPKPKSEDQLKDDEGVWFVSSQEKLQQDLAEMTLKSQSARYTSEARQNLARKERERNSKERMKRREMEKGKIAQEDQEDEAWVKFLFEQREREMKKQYEQERRSAKEREAESKMRRDRDRERERQNVQSQLQNHTKKWSQHESLWDCFEKADHSSNITFDKIPWPPDAKHLLQWNIQNATAASNRAATVKMAYKKAALRWHPDKFTAKFGSKLDEAQRDEILQHIKDIFQTINSSFSEQMRQR